MQKLLRIVCWVTLFCDALGLAFTAISSASGAEVHVGSFKGSLVPGDRAFMTVMVVSIWTAVLACAALYFAKKRGQSKPA